MFPCEQVLKVTVASDLGSASPQDLQEASCVSREEHAQHGPGDHLRTVPAVMTTVRSCPWHGGLLACHHAGHTLCVWTSAQAVPSAALG